MDLVELLLLLDLLLEMADDTFRLLLRSLLPSFSLETSALVSTPELSFFPLLPLLKLAEMELSKDLSNAMEVLAALPLVLSLLLLPLAEHLFLLAITPKLVLDHRLLALLIPSRRALLSAELPRDLVMLLRLVLVPLLLAPLTLSLRAL